ncbi:hypothetical protein [Phenylobacterium immobile]|uniref:DODA-type extradiol aromatic ring-opening family dioxygenase n=1 Tax=Phenylobacterium immobile TaxID=21 RepID=UPI000B0AB5A6|nr:hypothetical protein [Phenylobacterium immobile]
MPVGLGIGVSHAPGMYLKTQEEWDNLWERLSTGRGIPQPGYVARETGEKLQEMIARIQAGHDALKKAYDEYDPEILIIIGGDQSEVFDRSNVPQLMMFMAESGQGRAPGQPMAQPGVPDKFPPIKFDIDVEFSKNLLNKLVKQKDFDVAFSTELKPLGRAHGLPHAFNNPASYILDDNHRTPTVIFYQNTYDPPSLSAKRCYDLGVAIAEICKNDPRRIAILGSGGLAHDPGGKRSGWLDQPLDKWFLEQIANGDGRKTEALFSFDSDTMVAGTGEIRAWITVAGAMETMGAKANVVDYVEAAKTVTGLGFAYWLAEEPQSQLLAAE